MALLNEIGNHFLTTAIEAAKAYFRPVTVGFGLARDADREVPHQERYPGQNAELAAGSVVMGYPADDPARFRSSHIDQSSGLYASGHIVSSYTSFQTGKVLLNESLTRRYPKPGAPEGYDFTSPGSAPVSRRRDRSD